MSSFFKGPNQIKVGEKFVVKIVGWNCVTQQPDINIKRGDGDRGGLLELAERTPEDLPESVYLTGGMLLSSLFFFLSLLPSTALQG